MDEQLHKLLLAADRPASYSGNDVYDGDAASIESARLRGKRAVGEIGAKLRINLVLADEIQDAFFWGIAFQPELDESERPAEFGLKFSCCADLVATWDLPGKCPLQQEKLEQVQRILQWHGFQWVNGNILRNERYDGVYDYFKSWHYNAPATWWDRFFEYA